MALALPGGSTSQIDAPETPQGQLVTAGDRLDSAVNKYGGPPAHKVDAVSGGTGPASYWPSRLYSTDPRDGKYQLMRQFINKQGVVPGVGLSHTPDQFWDYAYEKHQQMQLADFRNWLLSTVVDVSSPEKQSYWKAHFPELFNDKLGLARDQLKLAQQMQKIQILGPENIDDYYLIYALSKGLVKVNNVAPWNPDFVPKTTDMSRGLFNWKRFFPSSGINGGLGNYGTKLFNWQQPFALTGSSDYGSPLTNANNPTAIANLFGPTA